MDLALTDLCFGSFLLMAVFVWTVRRGVRNTARFLRGEPPPPNPFVVLLHHLTARLFPKR